MLDSGQDAPFQEAETVDDSDRSVQRSGSLTVFEMKKVSLLLNKEIHGRRLLLLEAGTSSVSECLQNAENEEDGSSLFSHFRCGHGSLYTRFQERWIGPSRVPHRALLHNITLQNPLWYVT